MRNFRDTEKWLDFIIQVMVDTDVLMANKQFVNDIIYIRSVSGAYHKSGNLQFNGNLNAIGAAGGKHSTYELH